jgi:hypothetical protein
MNIASHDLTTEVSGAHMLTNDEKIYSLLDPILKAATEASFGANAYENTIIMAGETPNAAPLYMAMEKLSRKVADATRSAGNY